MEFESIEFENGLVTSINGRILFALSISILKSKPVTLSHFEYCKQLKEGVVKKLKEHDPYGILFNHQRNSLLRCIQEILPGTPLEETEDDIEYSQFTFETLNVLKQNKRIDLTLIDSVIDNDGQTEKDTNLDSKNQSYDSGIQSNKEYEFDQFDSGIQTYRDHTQPQEQNLINKDLENVSSSLVGDSESDQWTNNVIRNNIDFLRNILYLKALLKKKGSIPTNALVNILFDSETNVPNTEQYSSVSAHMLEYKLHEINSDGIIENTFTQVLNYLEDNLFTEIEQNKHVLLNYKGTDMNANMSYFLEVLPLCPRYLHDKLFYFIREHMKSFFIDCNKKPHTPDELEQISCLLFKLCGTKHLLINTIHFILDDLLKLARMIKALPSVDRIADKENGPLLRRLVNTTHLLSLAKQCLARLGKTRGNEKKADRLINIWRSKNRKIIETMREFFFLFVIESDGVFRT